MSRTKISSYSDSGRETPERQDFEDVDVILGVGDYTENVQRPDREKGDVLSDSESTTTLEEEMKYLEDRETPAYLVPGNQDGFEEGMLEQAASETNTEVVNYEAVPVGEDTVIVVGGTYAHPEVPVYMDDFEREIGLPTTSSLDKADYDNPQSLMRDLIQEEEEMLPGTVGEALQSDNLADVVSSEARQAFARTATLENWVSAINNHIDSVDDSKTVVFAHHGVPNGADLEDYSLDLIENPGTHVHGKNYGSLTARRVVEQNPDSIDAVVGGHFEGQTGRAEIEEVPVFNTAKVWTDLIFDSEGLVDMERRLNL